MALTVACLWLGWRVQRARERGAAIDAILAVGSEIYYELGEPCLYDPFDEDTRAPHFWLDVRRLPVEIILPEDIELDAHVASQLKRAAPLQKLAIGYAIQDHALEHLVALNAGCWVILLDPQYLSAEAISEIRQAKRGLTVSK